MVMRRIPKTTKKIRVLVCDRCQSIETLPHFDGKNPDHDVLLMELVDRHLTRHRDATVRLFGSNPEMQVMTVAESDWKDEPTRKQIIKKIRNERNHTGLGDEFYATKDTFTEDAIKCYSKHRRPTVPGCIDYMDKSKLLGNSLQNDEDLRELTDDQRRNLRDSRPKVYLCHFCPYHSMVISNNN